MTRDREKSRGLWVFLPAVSVLLICLLMQAAGGAETPAQNKETDKKSEAPRGPDSKMSGQGFLAKEGETGPRVLFLGEDRLYGAMRRVFESNDCRVATCALGDLKTPKGCALFARELAGTQLLFLGGQESSAILLRDTEGRAALERFWRHGGVAFCSWGWTSVEDWGRFFKTNGVWYAPLETIKPFLPHRIAFPSKIYVPNGKIKHPLLSEPNKLDGIMGYQNFGLPLPEGKGFVRLIVSEDNTASVGVTLQEGVLGRGSVLFADLYLFLDVSGEKTFKRKDDPMARHSIEFLENLAKYAQRTADVGLAEAAASGLEKAQGTPAQEAVNYVKGQWGQRCLKRLKGELPCTAAELGSARASILRNIDQIEKGPGWPRPAPAVIPYVAPAPSIDGKLDDPVWQKALVYRDVYPFNEKERQETPGTVWRLLWDEQYLYFACECTDEQIVAPDTKHDDYVYKFDCVEIFIMPDIRLGMLYWEIEVSPTGVVLDMLLARSFVQGERSGQIAENVAGLQWRCVVDGTPNKSGDKDKGYTVEVAVPVKELPGYMRGNAPRPGDTLHLALVRMDHDGAGQRAYSVVPLLGGCHNVWDYIPVTLGKL